MPRRPIDEEPPLGTQSHRAGHVDDVRAAALDPDFRGLTLGQDPLAVAVELDQAGPVERDAFAEFDAPYDGRTDDGFRA